MKTVKRMKTIYEQMATNYRIWGEYMDPEANMTEQQFLAMSIDERMLMIDERYGAGETQTKRGTIAKPHTNH